jgi:hypothetical protein
MPTTRPTPGLLHMFKGRVCCVPPRPRESTALSALLDELRFNLTMYEQGPECEITRCNLETFLVEHASPTFKIASVRTFCVYLSTLVFTRQYYGPIVEEYFRSKPTPSTDKIQAWDDHIKYVYCHEPNTLFCSKETQWRHVPNPIFLGRK